MVGKILDKRYVVLEEIGEDGDGFRYLVYDMNSLKRLHVRVTPDEDGQLSGETYTVVEMDVPLQAKSKQTENEAAQTKDARLRLVAPGQDADRPRSPTPKGFQPSSTTDDKSDQKKDDA